MTGLRDRARGCLLGLAAGDALGRPAENLSPEEIRRRWGTLTELEPGPGGAPAGTDDTEYAIFAASLLTAYGSALTAEDVARAWREQIVTISGPMRGAGFSELGTTEALRRGLAPPLTGRAHLHGWSDGLAMRAAPYGIFSAGNPAEAARLAAVDGAVSHDGEGIIGGQAVAAAVAAAMGGHPEPIRAALDAIPGDSWTARNIRRGLDVIAEDLDAEALLEAVAVRDYPWTDLAPEAVALAFAAVARHGDDLERTVIAAANLGRDADTTAAIAGAVAGAALGEAAVPARWAGAIGPVRGACLPAMAGRHVLDTADALVAARSPA